MQKSVVYKEGVKYSFIDLAVKISSAMIMGGVLGLTILSGLGLKGTKSGFWDLLPSIH